MSRSERSMTPGAGPVRSARFARVSLRNFRPSASFSARKTATELGREVSAWQS